MFNLNLRRIIPARAGFTSVSIMRSFLFGDHPRSRGVYGATVPGPLFPRRIIPARAGFTLADPWNPNDDLPYQTAFTFTGDLAPAPPSCGSAVVSRRSTTTPSAA